MRVPATPAVPATLDVAADKLQESCGAFRTSPDVAALAPSNKVSPPPPQPLPEGGWGWVVVIGVAVTNMTNLALFSVFGLLFGRTLESWGLETTGVAVISSTMNAVQNFSGLVSGSLLKYVGPKTVSLAGGLLVAGGMILSSLATKPGHILLSYSFLVGLGIGLLQPSTFLTVSSYFKKRRAQAVGISLAGTGLGQIAMPHLVRHLLGKYHFSGAVLILGATALHSIPGCLLYRPPSRAMSLANAKTREVGETQPLREKPNNIIPKVITYNAKEEVVPLNGDLESSLDSNRGSRSNRSVYSFWKRLVRSVDLDLLWNPRFLNLAAGTGFLFTAQTSFSMIFPFFLLESVGLSVSATATCMSVQSGADVLARLLLPLCTDRLHMRARTVMLVGSLLAALTRSIMAQLTGFPELVTVSAVTGFFRGATVLNQNLVIAEHVPPAQLPAALGMAMAVKGVCVLSLGSLIGMVRDATGSFPLFIHCLTGLVFLTGIIWLLEAAFFGCTRR